MKLSKLILLAGDVTTFFASLYLSLLVRYGRNGFYAQWLKLWPIFSFVLALWLFVFYSANFYDNGYIRNNYLFITETAKAFTINLAISVSFFYLIGHDIAPKRILIFLTAIYFLLFLTYRMMAAKSIRSLDPKTKVMFLGSKANMKRLLNTSGLFPENNIIYLGIFHKSVPAKTKMDSHDQGKIIVYDQSIANSPEKQRLLFSEIYNGYTMISLDNFFENISGKIPLSTVGELWFLENVNNGKRLYMLSKRIFDIFAAVLVLLIFIPILPLIALCILIDDGKPILFIQDRVGQGGTTFRALKFRTMKRGSDKTSPWTSLNDKRLTRFGHFLRTTHLDEIPQLFNVLVGHMSLVGTRPEQISYSNKLEKIINYYKIRNIIRPGITGWAQIKYHYAGSVAESKEKLEYELYYIKNRSMSLDLSILAKTFYQMFNRNGR